MRQSRPGWNVACAFAVTATLFVCSCEDAPSSNAQTPTADSVTASRVTSQRKEVTLTAPQDGERFGPSDPIVLRAAVAPSADNVERIEFLSDGAVVATSSSAPFQATFRTLRHGDYLIRARAVLRDGSKIDSHPTQIHVPLTQPQRELTADDINRLTIGKNAIVAILLEPHDGAVFTAQADIVVRASAVATNGSVERVEIIRDGRAVATLRRKPYETVLRALPPGEYNLRVRAVRNDGMAAESKQVVVKVQ